MDSAALMLNLGGIDRLIDRDFRLAAEVANNIFNPEKTYADAETWGASCFARSRAYVGASATRLDS
jgi:hypothetical protein